VSKARKSAVALALLLSAGAASAATGGDINTRVERLERLLDSQSLVDMVTRLEQLQREVQSLRGQVEEQNHIIEGLKRRQRELYLDVDRRLSQMEREGPAPGSVPANAAAPANNGGAAAPEEERKAYQQAFDLLRDLQYAKAITAFRQFLKQYPDGRYAHIAQYWLGEANYAQRNFKAAIADYSKLLEKYPNSPKLAEAMLKIGYSYSELGNRDAATKMLQQLVDRYPGTTEAGQARSLLNKFRRGG
jgi:tol-pal system protein YbgF